MNLNNGLFGNLPETVCENFEKLFNKNAVGLMPLSPRDLAVKNNGHVVLKIPYAGKLLKWEIIFDIEDYDWPPNFYFYDDDFLSDPDLETVTKEIPSLAKWNPKDSTSLTQILSEMMVLYKKCQIDKLRKENFYSHLYEDYEALATENGVHMVEVSIEGPCVTFFVALKIDCSDLPNYIQDGSMKWRNPLEDFAHLKISITNMLNSRFAFYLQLSPRLEQVLGSMSNITVPNLKKESSIIEYVMAVNKLINERIEDVALHFKLKKIFVFTLVAKCWETIIDYDTQALDKVTFLYKLEDYMCLVTVRIGPKFPIEKPQVKVSSIYCQESRNCNEILDKYPYNPSREAVNNINCLLEYLEDIVERFKNHQHT